MCASYFFLVYVAMLKYKNIRFSISEVYASEILEKLEEMFPLNLISLEYKNITNSTLNVSLCGYVKI